MSRSRSRSPLRSPDLESRSQSRTNPSPSSDISTCVLHLYNIPKGWHYEDVRTFIKNKNKTAGFLIKFIKTFPDKRKGECLLKFASASACRKGFELINGMECPNGNVIKAEYTKETITEPTKFDNKSSKFNNQPKKPQNASEPSSNAIKNAINKIKQQVENMKPTGSLHTYGLSAAFLESLGIKPPLLDIIFITNLDPAVNEEKIREIFGRAGQIVSVQMGKRNEVKNHKLWAKVEYDHPVEAVQAISMLHDRTLFGRKLVVQMDSNPRLFRQIPDGLSGFGPGLGENGDVLKGVRTTVEVQLLKNISERTQNESQEPVRNQQLPVMQDPMAMMNMQSNMSTMNNILPLNQNSSLLGIQGLINPQIQHGLYHAGNNELMTALAALQSQTLATNMPIVAQNVPVMAQTQSDWSKGQSMYNQQQQDNTDQQYSYSKTGSSQDSRSNRNEADNQSQSKQRRSEDRDSSSVLGSDMLVFNNLPPSVTLAALNTKMREVGDVKFAEMTGQGRAIVRFFSPRDAERCVNLFDRSKVDGQVIDVRFF